MTAGMVVSSQLADVRILYEQLWEFNGSVRALGRDGCIMIIQVCI